MKLEFTPIPTMPVPDYNALALMVLEKGPILIGPDANKNALHSCLHKFGISVYQVIVLGKLVAYSIERKRRTNKKKGDVSA